MKSTSFRRVAVVAVAALAIAAAASVAQYGREGLEKGKTAPDIRMKDIKGNSFVLSKYKGKPVFVNFWATWCPPCVQEFPEISKLHKKYASKGVKVVSLSVDESRTLAKVKPFVEKHKAAQQVLLGSGSETAGRNYVVSAIPMNYLIGRDGKIAGVWVGFSGPSDVREWQTAIDKELKKKAPPKPKKP